MHDVPPSVFSQPESAGGLIISPNIYNLMALNLRTTYSRLLLKVSRMAAAFIKAANAKIRSNPWTDYFCSTHFWGPASNFTIPLAAIADTQKSADLISGKMTCALIVYAFTFMRFSLAVRPPNGLLFGCHTVNATAQSIQGYRFVDWHYWGGKEKKLLDEKEAAAKGKPVQVGPAVVEKKAESGDTVEKK